MRVTKLSGKNVKGQTFSHTLTPVTLFHGRNWAGKTARLDALTLALSGYLPGVATKPNEVFDRVASGNPMEVEAATDNGLVLNRLWTRNGKGTVSVADETCEGFEMPAVALDPSEFLGLSARERVKFLFSRCTMPPELSDKGAVTRALVANVKNIKLEENTEASESAIEQVVKTLSTMLSVGTVQEHVEQLVFAVGESKKAAVAAVQRMEKTGQGLTQTALEGAAPPADAEHRLAAARTEQEKAAATLHAAQHELSRCRDEWREADALSKAAPLAGERRQKVVELEASLKGYVVPPHPADNDGSRANFAGREVAKLETIVGVHRDNLSSLEEELADIQKAKSCPKCGQSMDKLKPKMVKAQKELIKEGEQALATAKADLIKAQADKLAADKEWTDWTAASLRWRTADRAKRDLEHDLFRARELLTECAKAGEAAARLPSLEAKGKELADKIAELETTEHNTRTAVAARDIDYKRLVAARSEEATRARAVKELSKARAEAEVWKQTQKLVAELQGKMVSAAVGPIVARANELCGGLLRGQLALVDGELVMASEARLVSHRTFSGTEKALAYCALSVALSVGAPLRLAVIDEVGRLDAVNKAKLVHVLLSLIEAGKLDQAVIVDTTPLMLKGKGYAEVEVI